MGEPVSDPRDDDEPVSIEADAPEADWIEQHQPVIEEPDEDRLPTGDLPEDVAEAGALEELEEEAEEWAPTGDDVAPADEPAVAPPPRSADEIGAIERADLAAPTVSAAARGCNLIAALVEILLRSGWEAARQLAGGKPRSPG
jgi:hypothetical protein